MNRVNNEIAVVLPAFNEEVTLERTIKKLKKVVPTATVIVVDNASTDKTSHVAHKMRVNVIHEPRRGKGFAVQRGFDFALNSGASKIVLLDADDTYGVERIPEALKLITEKGFDLITGTRVPTTRVDEANAAELKHFRFGHEFGNRFFEKMNQILLPAGIKDVLSGWRVMSRRFVASFPGEAKGFEIEAQLNSHAFNMNAATENVEVDYFPRPLGSNSKLHTYRDGMKILRVTLKNFRNHRPLFAFSLLAFPWALLTIYFVYLPVSVYFERGVVPYLPRLIAGVGTFIVAALLWNSGMILERIRQVRIGISLRVFNQNSF